MVSRFGKMEDGTPIQLPETKRVWRACFIIGALFWLVAVVLWVEGSLDEAVLFAFDADRVAMDQLAVLAKVFSAYGMAAISTLFVIYLLLSKFIPAFDAPLTVYFYTICSYGLSGIAGDLLKQVLARPRPRITFAGQILALSTSTGFAMPSGHATKSVALVLPFLLLVSHSKNLHKSVKLMIGLTAAGVCVSRVVLGAHYVSDVLAGIGTALMGLPLTMLFANMVLSKAKQEKLPVLSVVWGVLLVFLTLLFIVL